MEKNYGVYISKIMRENRRKLNHFTTTYNITGKQSRILHYIYNESKVREVNQKDLEEFFNIRGASVTSLLQTLEKKKFIVRKPSKVDARRKVLKVTSKGEDVYYKIKANIDEVERVMIAGISEEDLAVLRRCFEKILDNLMKCAGESNSEYDLNEVVDE